MPRASTVHAVIAIGIDLGKSTLASLASKQESHGNCLAVLEDVIVSNRDDAAITASHPFHHRTSSVSS
jgi:hypothetical protein